MTVVLFVLHIIELCGTLPAAFQACCSLHSEAIAAPARAGHQCRVLLELSARPLTGLPCLRLSRSPILLLQRRSAAAQKCCAISCLSPAELSIWYKEASK